MIYLDDKLPTHPKIFKAGAMLGKNGPAQALSLFVAGIGYAREHLTDGFLPDQFVSSCGLVETPQSVAKALSSRAVRMWHRTRGGYRIHDFHVWNKKASEIKEKRERDRHRKAGRKNGAASSDPGVVPRGIRAEDSALSRAVVPGIVVLSDQGGVGGTPVSDVSEAHRARSVLFCVRYAELFAAHRHGAAYCAVSSDIQAAIELTAVWPDERLELLVEAFLTTDDPFCRNGSGSIAHFRSRASWCDSKLKAAGI